MSLPDNGDAVDVMATPNALSKEGHVVVLHHRLTGDFNNALGIAAAIADKLSVPVVVRDIRSRTRVLDRALLPLIGTVRKTQSNALKRFLFRLFFFDKDGRGLAPDTACVISTLGAGEAPNAFYSAATGAVGVHLGRPKRMPRGNFDVVIAHQGHEASDDELALPISPSRIRRRFFPRNEMRTALLLAIGGNAKDAEFPDEFWPDLTERAMEMARRLQRQFLVTTSPRTGNSAEDAIEARLRQLQHQRSQLVLYGRGERASMRELLRNAGLVIVSAESVSMISSAIGSGARVAAAYWQELPPSPRISGFLREQVDAGRVVLWDLSRDDPPDFVNLVPMEDCWSEVLWRAISPALEARLRATQ